jgi:hypothetical protein
MAELWNDARLRNMVEFRVEVDCKGYGTMWLEEISSDLPLELELELGEFLYQLRAALGERLSKVLADGDSGASDWRKPELVVESVA